MKKTTLAVLAAALLAGVPVTAAAAQEPAHVEPDEAAAGSPVTITGPPGPVTLEPLGGATTETLRATIPASGTLVLGAPQAPAGTRYRVVVEGAGESPVLTITEKLDGTTSGLLLGFGFLFVLGLAVGGIVFHRRWRDAIS